MDAGLQEGVSAEQGRGVEPSPLTAAHAAGDAARGRAGNTYAQMYMRYSWKKSHAKYSALS